MADPIRRLRSPSHAAVVAAALSLALCSCGGPDEDVAATVAGPTPSARPGTDAAAIRDVDLSTLTWLDTPRDTSVTLTGDAAVGDPLAGGQYALGKLPVVHADVDGDGFEDAFASLSFIEGSTLSLVWYIWRWDPETQKAVQIPDPIAQTERCATDVTDVAAGDGAFVITERRRELSDADTCDSTTPHQMTRTIALEGGSPVQREGHGGYGGACPQPQLGDADAYPIEDTLLFSAPDESSTPIAGDDISSAYALPLSAYPYLERDGWVLVGFGPSTDSDTFDDYGAYVPCGWAQVDG